MTALTPTKRQRVRFGANSEQVFARPFSESDKPQLWYSRQELNGIRADLEATILSVIHHNQLQEGQCFRGLETITNRKFRRRVYQMEFMYFHKSLKVTDPEGLRLFAEKKSQDSLLRALNLAQQDAMEVGMLLMEIASQQDAHVFVDPKKENTMSSPLPMYISRGDEKSLQLGGKCGEKTLKQEDNRLQSGDKDECQDNVYRPLMMESDSMVKGDTSLQAASSWLYICVC